MLQKQYTETMCETDLLDCLYPTLEVHRRDFEMTIKSSPSSGVALAEEVFYQNLPDGESQGLLICEKFSPKLLGFLHRIRAIITLDEDASTHTSIVCRAQGVPLVNLSRDDFKEILKLAQCRADDASIAVDTFRKRIVVGKIVLLQDHVLEARKQALRLIKTNTLLDVNANADTAPELRRAIELGFCHAWPRSETLLYDKQVFPYFIAFLLDPTHEYARQKFIEGHTQAVKALFQEAWGTRVAFRLLDPPSHEFLPSTDDTEEIERVASILGIIPQEVCSLIKAQRESNPMIGYRGARLLLMNRMLFNAQVLSMFTGWLDADPARRPPYVEILVPFVMLPSELKLMKSRLKSLQAEECRFAQIPVKYGCMIEIPTILDYPEEIAAEVDFISFGTNDLVAISHGIARGDAYERYLSQYIQEEILQEDPFVTLPSQIVKKIQDFCLIAKKINPNISTDICGEQALNTDLSSLIAAGALNAVSIGTENLPVLFASLVRCGVLKLSKEENLRVA